MRRLRDEPGRPGARPGAGAPPGTILPALCSVCVHLLLGAAFVRWGLPAPTDARPHALVRATSATRAPATSDRAPPPGSPAEDPLPPPRTDRIGTASLLPPSAPDPHVVLPALPPQPAPSSHEPFLPLTAQPEPRPVERWPTRLAAPNIRSPVAAARPVDVQASPPGLQVAAPDETATVVAPSPDADNLPPDYPAASRRAREEGTVIVEVEIDAGGRVTAARVAEGSGHAALDDAALRAARAWRFEPARENGLPVPGRLRLPVTFRLRR